VRRSGRDGIVALIFPVVPSLYAEPSDRSDGFYQTPANRVDLGCAIYNGLAIDLSHSPMREKLNSLFSSASVMNLWPRTDRRSESNHWPQA
jgi:hypothetical protein